MNLFELGCHVHKETNFDLGSRPPQAFPRTLLVSHTNLYSKPVDTVFIVIAVVIKSFT